MTISVPPPHWPSLKDLHARRCFLLGITDAEKVKKLWQAEVEERKREGGTCGRFPHPKSEGLPV